MSEAIEAYRHVAASPELREAERMRSKARHDEAQALAYAERKEREKWQVLIADKDAELADKDAELTDKDAELADKDVELADKDAVLANKNAALADKNAAFTDKNAALADNDVIWQSIVDEKDSEIA